MTHSVAFVAPNDAPLIGGRAATRGRNGTEGGDAHAGVKRRYPFELQPREPDRAAGASTRWRPVDRRKRARTHHAKPAVAPPNVRHRNARGDATSDAHPRRCTRPSSSPATTRGRKATEVAIQSIASWYDSSVFDHQHDGSLQGARAVGRFLWNDKSLSRRELNRAVFKIDKRLPLYNIKEFVIVIVLYASDTPPLQHLDGSPNHLPYRGSGCTSCTRTHRQEPSHRSPPASCRGRSSASRTGKRKAPPCIILLAASITPGLVRETRLWSRIGLPRVCIGVRLLLQSEEPHGARGVESPANDAPSIGERAANAGASQRKVAMGTPARRNGRWRYPSERQLS